MRLWRQDQLESVDKAINRARSGEPTVLSVRGAAGSGKTSLLDHVVDRATGFTVLHAEGIEGDYLPYRALAQWGLEVTATATALPEPFAVAQRLREMIDRVGTAPLLLRLDDLHWVDAESVSTLLLVLGRATTERLLVTTGTRSLAPGRHPDWQRWSRQSRRLVDVELTGLTTGQVATLLSRTGRPVPADLAEALCAHTAGNPLYTLALLDEYEPAELAARTVLPAPAEFARTVATRAARLTTSARSMLGMVAVLGGSWHSLIDVATMTGIDEPATPAQELVDTGLLRLRSSTGGESVRVAHALIRSAVYEGLALAERKRMHGRAAAVLVDEVQVLDHRLAAAITYDDELASLADAYAQRLRIRHAWRVSARYLRAASMMTTDGALRRRRWLESLFDISRVPDVAAARAELAAQPASDDPAELTLRGLLEVADHRLDDAVDLLRRVLDPARPAPDPVTRYRAGAVLADAMHLRGDDPAEIDRVLRQAEAVGVHDPAMAMEATRTRTFLDERLLDFAEHWATVDPNLGDPQSVPVARNFELGRRAVVAVRVGLYDVAAADLGELMRRFRDGVIATFPEQVPDGLGFVQWLLGDWQAARVSLHLANEIRGGSSYLPYLQIGEGRLDDAEAGVARMVEIARRRPWAPGRTNALHLLVARAHTADDPAEQRRVGEQSVADIERVTAARRPQTVLWLVSAGVAADWAGRPDLTTACADLLDAARPAPPWAPAGVAWLRALAARATGDPVAPDLFARAAGDQQLNLPYYRAHILVDQARSTKDRAVARAALARAEQIYDGLGARLDAARVRALLDDPAAKPRRDQSSRPSGRTRDDTPRIPLTDRERDVLTLVINGMSYAQIAGQLFITQKTVGFHLSRMYAKAGVTGRHQLTDLARRFPDQFVS